MSGFLASKSPFGIRDMILNLPQRTVNTTKAPTIKVNIYRYLSPTPEGRFLGSTQGGHLDEPVLRTLKLGTSSCWPNDNQDGHVEGLALCASISFLSGLLLLVKANKEQNPEPVRVQRGTLRRAALSHSVSEPVFIGRRNYLGLMTFWTWDPSKSPQSAVVDNKSTFLTPSLQHQSVRVGRDSQLPGSAAYIVVNPDCTKSNSEHFSTRCPNPLQNIIYSLVSYIVCSFVCYFVRIWFSMQRSDGEKMASNLKRTGKGSHLTSTAKPDTDITKANDWDSSNSGDADRNVDIPPYNIIASGIDNGLTTMAMATKDQRRRGGDDAEVRLKNLARQQSSQNQERNKHIERSSTRSTRRHAVGKAPIQNISQLVPESQDDLNTLSAEHPLPRRISGNIATLSTATRSAATVSGTAPTGIALPESNSNTTRMSELFEPLDHENQSYKTPHGSATEKFVKSREIPCHDNGTRRDLNIKVKPACLPVKETDASVSSDFSLDFYFDSDLSQNGSDLEEHDAWSQIPTYFPDHIDLSTFSGRFGPPDSPIVGILNSHCQDNGSRSTDIQAAKRQSGPLSQTEGS